MIDKALLAKIRKCFALASSANEHEAAAALAKARALMEEHGITPEQLAMADVAEASARASRTKTPPRWENYLCAAVRRALGVQAFLSDKGDRKLGQDGRRSPPDRPANSRLRNPDRPPQTPGDD